MKKIFSIIMLLALTATTAFVFASSKKFANEGLYFRNASGTINKQVSDEPGLLIPSGSDITTGSSSPSIQTTVNGHVYTLNYFDGSSYSVVNPSGTW